MPYIYLFYSEKTIENAVNGKCVYKGKNRLYYPEINKMLYKTLLATNNIDHAVEVYVDLNDKKSAKQLLKFIKKNIDVITVIGITFVNNGILPLRKFYWFIKNKYVNSILLEKLHN